MKVIPTLTDSWLPVTQPDNSVTYCLMITSLHTFPLVVSVIFVTLFIIIYLPSTSSFNPG